MKPDSNFAPVDEDGSSKSTHSCLCSFPKPVVGIGRADELSSISPKLLDASSNGGGAEGAPPLSSVAGVTLAAAIGSRATTSSAPGKRPKTSTTGQTLTSVTQRRSRRSRARARRSRGLHARFKSIK